MKKDLIVLLGKKFDVIYTQEGVVYTQEDENELAEVADEIIKLFESTKVGNDKTM